MYHSDWLDDLRWGAIGVGVAAAFIAQVLLTLVVLRPFNLSATWAAIVLVELCVAFGAFVAGWRTERAAFVNGAVTGLLSAGVSLVATAVRSPAQITVWSILFLFASFAVFGVLGGFLGERARSRREAGALR